MGVHPKTCLLKVIVISCLNLNLKGYRPWWKLFGLLSVNPKRPTGEQPFSNQGYSHHMCQLRCFCLFSSPQTNPKTWSIRGTKGRVGEKPKWNQQHTIDFRIKTHTQLPGTYKMEKHLFCFFLCSHLSGLQKDAYWNKIERVPRWLMLCFGSDALKGKIVWFTLFLIQNYDIIWSPSYRQIRRGYYFSITNLKALRFYGNGHCLSKDTVLVALVCI